MRRERNDGKRWTQATPNSSPQIYQGTLTEGEGSVQQTS